MASLVRLDADTEMLPVELRAVAASAVVKPVEPHVAVAAFAVELVALPDVVAAVVVAAGLQLVAAVLLLFAGIGRPTLRDLRTTSP